MDAQFDYPQLGFMQQCGESPQARTPKIRTRRFATDIHPMAGFMRPKLAQDGVTDGAESLPCGRPCANAGDISAFRSWNRDFSFIKPQPPLVFACTHDNQTPHANARSGGRRRPWISHRRLARRFLGIANPTIWRASRGRFGSTALVNRCPWPVCLPSAIAEELSEIAVSRFGSQAVVETE